MYHSNVTTISHLFSFSNKNKTIVTTQKFRKKLYCNNTSCFGKKIYLNGHQQQECHFDNMSLRIVWILQEKMWIRYVVIE